MPTRSRFLSAPPPTPSAAWWKAWARARSATTPSDGTSTTSSHCRRVTGSFTRAAAARRACSRCPTAICTPGSGFLRKNTGISRPEASSVPWQGGGCLVRGKRCGCAGTCLVGACCPRVSGDIRRRPFAVRRDRPRPMAQVANENTGSQLAAVQRAVIAGKRGADVRSRAGFWALTLGTIGVVYGDIGTSPLYAMRESLVAAVGAGNVAGESAVLGILSLIIWALVLVVTLKYVVILLRADNNGEGGTLALMALAQRALSKHAGAVVLCGIASAALFYGDAMITPALSVLSAIEGLKVVTPAFDPYVVPFTGLILVLLFAFQSRGTAKVAAFFGPIMLVWFVVIAVAGLWQVMQNPAVLWAFNPIYGVKFLAGHGMIGLVTLGAVFLVVTGSEALYADLGHFGRGPIQTAWLTVALPALTVNYLGQGALVLLDPKSIENPFFLLYSDWAQLPMVVLATAATVIASQA